MHMIGRGIDEKQGGDPGSYLFYHGLARPQASPQILPITRWTVPLGISNIKRPMSMWSERRGLMHVWTWGSDKKYFTVYASTKSSR